MSQKYTHYKVLLRYFYPMHKPPTPQKKTHPELEILRLILFKPLGCLLLVSTTNADRPHQLWTTMETPATSWKCPASSHLNTEARQPTPSVRSSSPPRILRSAPTTTNDEVMLYSIMLHRKGGRNRKKKCHIPCITPPLCFVLRLRLQREGRICWALRYVPFYLLWSVFSLLLGARMGNLSQRFFYQLSLGFTTLTMVSVQLSGLSNQQTFAMMSTHLSLFHPFQ